MALTVLDLNGRELNKELERLDRDAHNELSTEITQDGLTAEMSHEKAGWRAVAYVKKLWQGPWIGGGRVSKKW